MNESKKYTNIVLFFTQEIGIFLYIYEYFFIFIKVELKIILRCKLSQWKGKNQQNKIRYYTSYITFINMLKYSISAYTNSLYVQFKSVRIKNTPTIKK